MKTKLILLFGLAFLLTQCQKRKYPEENVRLEKEKIFFEGSIDNEPIALKIGTDGYYCYSAFEQDADGTYIFEGTLKKFDCNPCPLSLRIELADYRTRLPGASVPVDSVTRSGSRSFIPGVSKPFILAFESQSNKTIASAWWALSNGKTTQGTAMTHEFTQAGPQTLSLTVRTTGNCESMVINKLFVDRENGVFACNATSAPLQGNSVSFSAGTHGGQPPFSYTWNFGDGSTSNLKTATNSYMYAGSYPVKLRVEDAAKHVCEYNYTQVAGNDQSSCIAGMSFDYAGSRNALLNGVRMQWTDKSNNVLRSDDIEQPAGSYFEVVNSQDFPANENDEAGRLLTLRFNVLLSDGTRKMWMKSENTAIVVTYK